jgi:predicted Zn-dependent protease
MKPPLQFQNLNNLFMRKSFIFILLIIVTGISSAQKSKDYYLSGVAKMKNGQPDSAIYFLNHAILQEPDNDQYYLKRGEIKYAAGKYEEAINDFENVDPVRTGMADLWLAKCYARLHDNGMAIEHLKNLLQSGSRINRKEIKKDEAFDQLQLTDEWFQLWQNDRYSDEELLEDDIDFLINQQKYLDALSLIDKKLEGSEKREILFRYRARIDYLQGNYRASAKDWTKVINENKNDYRAYKERGIAFLKSEKFRESADDFSKTLRMEPADFELYILRSKAEQGQNDMEAASRDLSTYLKYFPDDEKVLLSFGELQYEDGNYVNALRSFNKCLMLNDSNPLYYKARGKTYLQTSLYKYAIDDLSMSLDLNAQDGETYYFKGLARFFSGDKSGACDDWKESALLGEAKAMQQLINNCQ